MRYPASVEARAWNGVIVNGLTGNQCIRVTLRQRQKAGDIFNGVLAVGVHLDRMAEAAPCAGLQSRHHRRAFPAVFCQPQQRDLWMARSEIVKRAARGFIAAVVHHQTG